MKQLFLIAILLGFPLAELVVLYNLSTLFGWWVLVWVVLAACAGMALIKEARFALLARLAGGFARGEFSILALTDSARTVLAGLFLIFPGVISDLIALALLLLPRPKVVIEPVPARASSGTFLEGEFRRMR